MSRPLLILRPQPGADATATRARAQGLASIVAPLFETRPIAWRAPDPAEFDLLVVSSANVFRHGGAELDSLLTLPVHAVGEATAEAARAAGFAVGGVGTGGIAELIADLPANARTLRLAGREHVPADLSTIIVYASNPLPLTPQAADALMRGAVTLLHSPRAARRLAAECERLDADRGRIALTALSPAVADAAGSGWAAVAIAEQPTDAALLCAAQSLYRILPNGGPAAGGA